MGIGTISLIATGLFILVLVAGFLIGLWRGFKKSLFNAILSIIGAVVAFFITPIITNAIMGIRINFEGQYIPLNEIIVNILRRNGDINALMENNPNMQALFDRLPFAIGNTIIFILLTLAIEFVLYIIYRIFASIFMRRKEGQKMHRLGGAFVGLVTFFAIFVFAFMPITSLLSTAEQLMTTQEYTTTETADADEVTDEEMAERGKGLLNQFLPKQVTDIVSGLSNSLIMKVSGMIGMDNVLFDYYSNFTVDNQKIYIRQEVVNYYQAADLLYQIGSTENINFKKLNYDKIQKILENVENGGLFKSVVPSTIKDLIVNYENYSILRNNHYIQEYQDIFDSVKAGFENVSGEELYNYVKNDIDKVFEIVKTLGKDGIVDEIKDLEEYTVENIVDVVADNAHIANVKAALKKIFDINVVKSSIGEVAEEVVARIPLENLGEVVAETGDWTKQEWDALAENVASSCEKLAAVLREVDFEDIYDFTKLIENTTSAKIETVLNNIGGLIDNVRANTLLRTSEDKSIFDSFLEANNLTLPTGSVKDLQDRNVAITTYADLMNFIKPAVKKVIDTNIYKKVTNTETTVNQKIEDLAGIISAEGNENILSEVLLPFYQIDVTKVNVFDKVSALNNDLVNFSALTSYNDWKTDLGYVSQILLALTDENAVVVDEGYEEETTHTYLQLVLNGQFNKMLDNLTDAQIANIIKPILYAKSTAGVRATLFDTLASTINNITGGDYSIATAGAFIKDDAEDQAQEICNVIKQFLVVGREANNIENINKTELGKLLDIMKENAYRKELAGKTNEGVLKGVFDGLYTKLTTTYTDINNLIGDKQVYEIDFEAILGIVDTITSAAENSFIDNLADMFSTDVTIESLNNLINTITDETTEDEIVAINGLFDSIEELNVDVLTDDTKAMIDENEETIKSQLDSNTNIPQETKNRILAFFGIEDAE